MTEELPPIDQPSGLSRRSVVRTAAHAAWVAPVIVAVSAVPAFAASGPAAITTTVSGATSGLGGITLTVTAKLTNANTGAGGVTTLAVTVNPTSLLGTVNNATPTITSADGWSYVNRSASGGARTFSFSRASVPGAASPTATASTTLVFTIGVSALSSGTLAAVPTVAGGGAASGGQGSY